MSPLSPILGGSAVCRDHRLVAEAAGMAERKAAPGAIKQEVYESVGRYLVGARQLYCRPGYP
jgi:hypothetical protein